MLFIWDLHIKTDMKDIIFEKLENILNKTDKKNIIFLGDFVYHFAYNPQIIWEFFDIILKYANNWKKIYILAWNHDYIKSHFIFSEAEKLTNLTELPTLHIISQPKVQIIGDKKILFLPFYTRIAKEEEFSQIDKKIKKLKNHKNKELIKNLFFTAYNCWKQDNKNMKISWSINLDLALNLLENENISMIIHHFYTENTQFPGQFSKFSFKNIALSSEIFKFDGEIISWHLHKWFKHKNYTCIWSFWNTSPLEENDIKVVYNYPDNFQEIIINPYITFEVYKKDKITKENILKKWKYIEKESETLLWKKIIKENFDIKKVNLVVKSKEDINIDETLNLDLLDNVKDIKFRQISKKNINNILQDLEVNKDKLSSSFQSWKELARYYIEKKYPENKEKYFKILEELKLI